MQTSFIHPLLNPLPASKARNTGGLRGPGHGKKLHRILIAQSVRTPEEMGFFEFAGDFFSGLADAIEGLADVMADVLGDILQTVGNIIDAVFSAIGDVLNLIDWEQIGENLGAIVRTASNIAVQLNPNRLIYNFLAENPVTAHTFKELDKFTGGMITNAVNVSDLVYRSARGDAISKEELIKDALFCLQVAAVVVGGPAAAGGLVGNMVGREACKNVGNAEAVEACRMAVTIAASATAQYASDVYGVSWGASGSEQVISDNAGQSVSSGATDTLVQSQQNNLNALFQESGVLNFSDYLSNAAAQVVNQRLTQEITKEAIRLCQEGNWVGDKECAILGQIASNYINAPAGMDWPTFLAQEAARLGVSLLMEQWFPKDSPERRAIEWQIKHVQIPGQTIVVTQNKKSNLGVFALLAAGAGALFIMGA